MADDKEKDAETAPGKQDTQDKLGKWREGLREAVAACCNGRRPNTLNTFLLNDPPPDELAGNRDRTFGFFYTTTILKALGEDEGLKAAMMYNPNLDEVATAYLVVFGRTLREDAPEVDARRVRRRLARACSELCDLVREVMAYADKGQHHALTTLMGECRWCAREVCGLDILLHGEEEKK